MCSTTIDNNFDDDYLIPLSLSEFEEIKIKMKSQWPQSIHAIYFFENYYQWLNICSDTRVKFFRTLSKNSVIAYLDDQNYIMTYNCDTTTNELVHIFDSMRINWKDGPEFGAMQLSECDAIYKEIERRGLEIELEVKSKTHFITKEEALLWDTSLPLNTYLKKLTASDTHIINNEWPYKFEGSEKFIHNQIVYNGAWALTTSTGEYMAWGLHNNYGGIGIIHTVPKHRRKGLGTLITKIVGKKIAEKNMDVFTVTSLENVSEQMMLNLGFKTTSYNNWIKIKAK